MLLKLDSKRKNVTILASSDIKLIQNLFWKQSEYLKNMDVELNQNLLKIPYLTTWKSPNLPHYDLLNSNKHIQVYAK